MALSSELLCLKFPFRNDRYKVYAFKIPIGKSSSKNSDKFFTPFAISKERRQSHYGLELTRIRDGNRQAYRISTPRFKTSAAIGFYFDPGMANNIFKLSTTLFSTKEETSNLRLEYKGIYEIGKFIDMEPRFGADTLTVIKRIILIALVAGSLIAGLCGYWLKKKWIKFKKWMTVNKSPKKMESKNAKNILI